MKRMLLAIALIGAWGFLVPAALAAGPVAHTGRVLISTGGNVSVPVGEQADVVVVVDGSATINGSVNTLVVVRGTANLEGARLESIVAVNSNLEVLTGTIISGEIRQLDSTVHQVGNVQILGGITSLSADLLAFGAVLAPAFVLLWLGFGLATIVAGLFLAAIATRQIRQAESFISREPLITGVTGLFAAVALPVLAVIAMATVIGAPLGVGFLVGVLPLVAFAGYIVAATWCGERVLRHSSGRADSARPYLAAVIGVVVLGAIGLVPVLGFVVMVASVLGFGAILRVAWDAMRGTHLPVPEAQPSAPRGAGPRVEGGVPA